VTTRKVIATEWVEGEQLAKSPPHVINKLISTVPHISTDPPLVACRHPSLVACRRLSLVAACRRLSPLVAACRRPPFLDCKYVVEGALLNCSASVR
jgi:hypothetical protein